MNSIVRFKSDRFRPFLPEDAQVNPGCYGAELAYWLARQLAGKRIVTSYPDYEDWGWFIEYITAEGDEYWLCCGNIDGTDKEWHLFLDPKAKRLFGRKKAPLDKARPLLAALREVLSEDERISDIQWLAP